MLKFVSILCFLQFLNGCTSQSVYSQVFNLRLNNNGIIGHSGILQRYGAQRGGGRWLNFCSSYGFDAETQSTILSVICRSLGYESNSSNILASAVSVQTNQPTIVYYDLRCTGTEEDLSDCSFSSEDLYSYCSEVYNITCPLCVNNQVRLTSGLVPRQGIVEVCINGIWSRACGNNWGYTSSFVVCRQLGYPSSNAYHSTLYPETRFQYSGYLPSNYTSRCFGNETTLAECSQDYSIYCDVSSIPIVSVWCRGDYPEPCTYGEIRLVGGTDQYEGIVQVCKYGLWGSLYNSQWNSIDTKVACRQLGLLQGNSSRVSLRYFNSDIATGPIYPTPSCTGRESRLVDCTVNSYYYYSISHYSDVGIRCHPTVNPVSQCSDGDARLVGGSTSNEGRIELCYGSVWGSVCDSYSGAGAAAVVCWQLGFYGSNHTIVYQYSNYQPYGEGTGPIHISRFSCSGYERNLLQCPRSNSGNGYHTCTSANDLAVICDTTPPALCTAGDLRLTDGYSLSDGVVQICVGGEWLAVCYSSVTSGLADLICRGQLQRNDIVSTFLSRSFAIQSNVSASITCSVSNPASITQDCSYTLVSSSTCTSTMIGCYVNDNCAENTVRLFNGTNSSNGLVQVCHQGVWGNIASYYWNTSAVNVVCRQLGLPTEWSHGDASYHNNMNSLGAPLYYDQVRCSGFESSILNCQLSNKIILSRSLFFTGRAPMRAMCQNNQSSGGHPPCNSGDVRLRNSTDNGRTLTGRIEICVEGVWATLCGNRGYHNESKTICRQLLGQPATVHYHIYNTYYGPSSLPVIHALDCPGDALSISQCTINHQPPPSDYSSYCSHREQLGIVCERDLIYEVKLTASQTPPFYVGQTVDFQSSISPQPPIEVYYLWSFSSYGSGYYFYSSSGSNLTVIISSELYHSTFLYCQVYINNFLVTGSMEITTEGLLSPIQPHNAFSSFIGQFYNFGVTTFNTTSHTDVLLYSLNWYFNGEQIMNTTNSTIMNRNTSLLTIVQEGIYEARYDKLSILPYDRTCESNLAKYLRGYVFMKPARFFVNTQESNDDGQPTLTFHEMTTTSQTVAFESGDNLVFYFESQIPGCLDAEDVDIRIDHNNNRYYKIYNYTKSLDGMISGYFVINNASVNDQGIYEASLLWAFNNKCYDYYSQINNFIFSSNAYFFYGHIERVLLARSHLKISYTESLFHSFYTNTTAISPGSGASAILTCFASIAYPQFSAISLVKNGITLLRRTQPHIGYITDELPNQIGKYECILNASDVIIKKNLTIKERADVVLNIQLPMLTYCNDGHIFTARIKSSILSYLRRQCSCDIAEGDINNVELDCRSGQRVYVALNIEYANDDGTVSATLLAKILKGLTIPSDLAFEFAGSPAQIISACDAPICTSIPTNSLTTVPSTTLGQSSIAATTDDSTTTSAPTTSDTYTTYTTTTTTATTLSTTETDVVTTGSTTAFSDSTTITSAESDSTSMLSEQSTTAASSSDGPTSNDNIPTASEIIATYIPPCLTVTPDSSTSSETSSNTEESTSNTATTPSDSHSTQSSEDLQSTLGTDGDERVSSTTHEGVGDAAPVEQVLPTPYLIGAFVGAFVGGALISAMVMSCVLILVMRSRKHKPAPKKMNFPSYEKPNSMRFSDLNKECTNIDEFTYEVMN